MGIDAAFYLVMLVFALGLGSYVLHENPKGWTNRFFALLAFVVAFWSFTHFMIVTMPFPASLTWFDVSGIGRYFVPSILLHLVLVFLKGRKILENKLIYPALYIPSFAFLYFDLTTDLIFLRTYIERPWGYIRPHGDFVWTVAVLAGSYASLAFYLSYRFYSKSTGYLERKQGLFLSVGVLFPFVFGIPAGFLLPWMGIESFGLTIASCGFGGILLGTAILRYKLFVLPPISRFLIPTPEDWLKSKPKYRLKKGGGYLIEEGEPKRGAKIFEDSVVHGVPGLWMTTSNPDGVRRKYKLVRTPILHLSPTRIDYEATVPPDELENLIGAIESNLFAKCERSVIFMDCLTELVGINGFEKAMNFLQRLAQSCSKHNSNLIVQINPYEFTKERIKEIEKVITSKI